MVNAYWFDQFLNFGDALTPMLLARAGYVPRLAPLKDAQFLGVGSILEMAPTGYSGSVWGSGLLYGEAIALPHATWLAVRGALTRDLVGAPSVTALGDPGLLASTVVVAGRPSRSLGIVPHHAHRSLPIWGEIQRRVPGSVVIDPAQRPSRVFRQISACSTVLTTSLHGLITADSYGIPAMWLTVDEIPLRGGSFKFDDYESSLNLRTVRRAKAGAAEDVLGQVRAGASSPAAEVVSSLQSGLLKAVSALTDFRSMSPVRSY
ncbi:polysaccharide pyruvyl transferase family protein [Ornithinimicrobium tianjinense]|uniref:polysaccharide pyruvyl transferase family protein n=1 Tax=Ornithinimicrobium tianjinense TaxID=1195761 RepID=UPI00166EF943|nr:polysaccharide pyruvyl transferase family protein [Ornithinimicrobium tianjinense]